MKYTKSYNVILDNMDINEYRLRPIAAIMYLQDAFARYCATKKWLHMIYLQQINIGLLPDLI